jgi:hypothetical protein
MDLLAASIRDWDKVQGAIVKKFGRKDYQSLIGQPYKLAERAESLEHWQD